MRMDITGSIGKAISEYCMAEVISIDAVLDPLVEGTLAIQAEVLLENIEKVQFLVTGVPFHKVTSDHLEEVNFTSWPPTSLGRPSNWRVVN